MEHIKRYAKAYAGAITVVLSFLVLQVGLELPDEVTGAITTILTGAIIAAVPNKRAGSEVPPTLRRR